MLKPIAGLSLLLLCGLPARGWTEPDPCVVEDGPDGVRISTPGMRIHSSSIHVGSARGPIRVGPQGIFIGKQRLGSRGARSLSYQCSVNRQGGAQIQVNSSSIQIGGD